MTLSVSEPARCELVDAIVAAVDLDRSDEVIRLTSALGCLGLDEAFADELRLSGVPSATWGLCPLCSEVVETIAAGVAA